MSCLKFKVITRCGSGTISKFTCTTTCISGRSQPGHSAFMPLPPRLQRELDELAPTRTAEVTEDPDFLNLVFKDFPLGDGYSVRASDLLLRIPRSYPDAGPDMFWVGPEVTLESGQPPQAAENIETYLSKPWRRFSWHRPSSRWNPTVDNLHSELE